MKLTAAMELNDFYQAFSPACFALLGLWLVAVQLRINEWQNDPERKRRAYGVALSFVLPGIMSVFSLIDENTSTFWRASFATVAFSGALIMFAVRGFPVPVEPGRIGLRRLPVPDRLGLAAYVTAIVLYLVIGVLALFGGLAELRTEAVLLTILVFLGFNVGWLLLFDDRSPSRVLGEPPPPTQAATPPARAVPGPGPGPLPRMPRMPGRTVAGRHEHNPGEPQRGQKPEYAARTQPPESSLPWRRGTAAVMSVP